jgi:hypothetical protein
MANVAKKKKVAAGSRAVTKRASPKLAKKKPAAAKKAVSKRPAQKRGRKKPAAVKKASPKKGLARKTPGKPAKAGVPKAKPAAPARRTAGKTSPSPAGAKNGASRHKNARRDGALAFLPDPTVIGHRRVRDDLAEELGEEFVAAVTSGEAVDDARDAPVPEEDGGPFVTTTANSQYGQGTDESNPEDAEREPFPTTRSERR